MAGITEGNDFNALQRSSFDGKRIPNCAIFCKRVAIEFLQILFGTRAQGSYHYDSDDTKTEIQIADVYAADLTSINVRPCIIVQRGPLSWQGTGLGGSSIESINTQNRDTIYNDLLLGSLSISCMSREGIEAEQIAHLVFNSFKFFTPTLRKKGFFSIKSLNIGSEALIEQAGTSDETYIVPISISVIMQDRWLLTDEAGRRLEQILVSGFSF
jgi:hypothetical protein